MPLSALVDGELVCAPLLDEVRWQAMKGHPVQLQPCGHPGFGRVSRLGTQHFVHERDSGCGHAESAEHLHLKAVIARGAAESGWQAATEVPGQGYVADVLAVNDQQRVAFEVQRSKQVLREYRHRQERYLQDGVRGVWLSKTVPSGYVSNSHLPLFLVTDWGGAPQAVVAGRVVPVPDLVGALLGGRAHWQETVMTDREARDIVLLMCPVCGTRRDVTVSCWRYGRCICGLPIVRQEPNPNWWEKSRCCGYWGPALILGRSTRNRHVQKPLDLGHWCIHAEEVVADVSA